MIKILVIGSFMMDLVAKTPRAPREGETIIGHSFSQFTGGKGANQAVAAAKLGSNVTMLGKVGEDSFGDSQINSLKSAGVNTEYVIKDNSDSTGVGFVTLEDNGKNRIIIIPGVNMLLKPSDIIRNEKLIKLSDIIILQLEIPLETVYTAIDIAYEYSKTIIFNPAPAAKINNEYLKKVSYFIPNEIEAKDFTGIDIINKESAKIAAAKLLKMGCQNIVITMGDKGVYFLNIKDEEYFVEGINVNVIDTTAAGDAFVGAFAFGLGQDLDHYDCLRLANASAALSVTRMGAQPSLPYLNEVRKFMSDRKIKIEKY